MMGMVKKQTKIVEKQREESKEHVPAINKKSRELASGRTLDDLFKPSAKSLLSETAHTEST